MQTIKLRRLGDVLVEQGAISEEQIMQALADQRQTKMQLGRFLLHRGLVTRKQLGKALAEQFEIPFFDFDPNSTHRQLVRLLPESFARRRKVAPLHLDDKVLRLGMLQPSDMEAISEVELMTGYQVEPVVCLGDGIANGVPPVMSSRSEVHVTLVSTLLVVSALCLVLLVPAWQRARQSRVKG